MAIQRVLPGQTAHANFMLGIVRGLDDKAYVVGEDMSRLYGLDKVGRELLVGENLPPFGISQGKGGSWSIKASTSIAPLYRSCFVCGDIYAPDIEFPPHIALLLECYRRHEIRFLSPSNPTVDLQDGRCVAHVVNDFMAEVRREAQQHDIAAKLKNWDRNPNENYRKLVRVLESMFERVANLVIIRLHLGYQADLQAQYEVDVLLRDYRRSMSTARKAWLAGEDPKPTRKSIPSTFARLMADREHFFDNIRRNAGLKAGMVGRVWAVEQTLLAGQPQLTVALLYDGDIIGTDTASVSSLTSRIGNYWHAEITGQRGDYRPVPLPGKWLDRHLIWQGNSEARQLLLRELGYLAKKDQLGRVKPTLPGKLFDVREVA